MGGIDGENDTGGIASKQSFIMHKVQINLQWMQWKYTLLSIYIRKYNIDIWKPIYRACIGNGTESRKKYIGADVMMKTKQGGLKIATTPLMYDNDLKVKEGYK